MKRTFRYSVLAIIGSIIGFGCSDHPRISTTSPSEATPGPNDESIKDPSNFEATLSDVIKNRETAEAAVEPADEGALRVIDEAVVAMGGPAAYRALARGHVKMRLIGDLPDLSSQLGSNTIDAEIYYQLPKYDRRRFSSDKAKDSVVIITNSGQSWSGNQKMQGSKVPAQSMEIKRGPFVIGMVQTYFDTATPGMHLRKDLTNERTYVIEWRTSPQMTQQFFFDRKSRLPMRTETTIKNASENPPSETKIISTVSGFEQFGSATLPTRTVLERNGAPVLEIVLESADFDSPIDESLFEIPQ